MIVASLLLVTSVAAQWRQTFSDGFWCSVANNTAVSPGGDSTYCALSYVSDNPAGGCRMNYNNTLGIPWRHNTLVLESGACTGPNYCGYTCFNYEGVATFTVSSGVVDCASAQRVRPIANSAGFGFCSLSKVDIKTATGMCGLTRNADKTWSTLTGGNCAQQECEYTCLSSSLMTMNVTIQNFTNAEVPINIANSSRFQVCGLSKVKQEFSDFKSGCNILASNVPGDPSVAWRALSGTNECGYVCTEFETPATTTISTTTTTTTTTASTTTMSTMSTTTMSGGGNTTMNGGNMTMTGNNSTTPTSTTTTTTTTTTGNNSNNSTTNNGNSTTAAMPCSASNPTGSCPSGQMCAGATGCIAMTMGNSSTAVGNMTSAGNMTTTLMMTGDNTTIVVSVGGTLSPVDAERLKTGNVRLVIERTPQTGSAMTPMASQPKVTVPSMTSFGPNVEVEFAVVSMFNLCSVAQGDIVLALVPTPPASAIAGTPAYSYFANSTGGRLSSLRKFDDACDSIVPKASVRAADKAVVFAADIESASCDVMNMVVPYLVCAGKRPAIAGAATKDDFLGSCEAILFGVLCWWHIALIAVGICVCCLLGILFCVCCVVADDDDSDDEKNDRVKEMILLAENQRASGRDAASTAKRETTQSGNLTNDMQSAPASPRSEVAQSERGYQGASSTVDMRDAQQGIALPQSSTPTGQYGNMPVPSDAGTVKSGGEGAFAYGQIELSVADPAEAGGGYNVPEQQAQLQQQQQWDEQQQQQQQQWNGQDQQQLLQPQQQDPQWSQSQGGASQWGEFGQDWQQY